MSPLSAALMRDIIDQIIGPKLTNALVLSVLIYVFSILLAKTLNLIHGYLAQEFNRKIKLYTKRIFYSKANELEGIKYFEDPDFHQSIQLARRSVEGGANAFINIVLRLGQITLSTLVFISILLAFSPILVLLLCIVALPQLHIHFYLKRRQYKTTVDNIMDERRAHYFERLLSELDLLKELQLFELRSLFLNKFLDLQENINKRERTQQLTELHWNAGIELILSLTWLLTFVVVIYQAAIGAISIGDVTFFLAAITSASSGMSELVHCFSQIPIEMTYFEHFMTIQRLPPALYKSQNPQTVPKLQMGIEFRNVSFRYREDTPYILRSVNLFIPAGKCLALVGHNGSGKSTLVKLITRLYDVTEGCILWDGIDIREFQLSEYRQRIRTTLQDFVRYALPVWENIGLGDLENRDNRSKIASVAQRINAHQMIEALPESYDTMLNRWLHEDTNGIDLSGGQWQKIALARSLIRDADLLVLDEPTAALDVQAEYDLHQSIREINHYYSLLLISHRFSTVAMADIIAVIDKGKIVECGSHEVLMQQNGIYTHLYNLQQDLASKRAIRD